MLREAAVAIAALICSSEKTYCPHCYEFAPLQLPLTIIGPTVSTVAVVFGVVAAVVVVVVVVVYLSEAGPGRFDRQQSLTDIYHTIPYHTIYRSSDISVGPVRGLQATSRPAPAPPELPDTHQPRLSYQTLRTHRPA